MAHEVFKDLDYSGVSSLLEGFSKGITNLLIDEALLVDQLEGVIDLIVL